jgi:hypothetical protein
MLDSIVGLPAFIRDGRLDVIGVNAIGRNLESLAFEQPGPPVNLTRGPSCGVRRRSGRAAQGGRFLRSWSRWRS